MKSKVPTIRQIAWISTIPHLTIMGIIILVFYQFYPNDAFVLGAVTYLLISNGLRTLIPRFHRKAIGLVRQQKFEEAISLYEKSYAFFTRNNWIDKYRYVTLLSSSKMSYTEMALNNIAFCYSQIGDGINSKKYYEKTLFEFPDSGIARAGLNVLLAGENNNSNGL